MCQNLNYIFYEVSEFKIEKIKRVRFGTKSFSTCQILKRNCIQKTTFSQLLLRENDIIGIFCAFLNCMIFNLKICYASEFEFKLLQRVRL